MTQDTFIKTFLVVISLAGAGMFICGVGFVLSYQSRQKILNRDIALILIGLGLCYLSCGVNAARKSMSRMLISDKDLYNETA